MVLKDKNRPPIHPGEILREDVLPGLGMSVTDAASEMHVTRQALHRVLAGTAAVSPEMALAHRPSLEDPTKLASGQFHPRYVDWLTRPR